MSEITVNPALDSRKKKSSIVKPPVNMDTISLMSTITSPAEIISGTGCSPNDISTNPESSEHLKVSNHIVTNSSTKQREKSSVKPPTKRKSPTKSNQSTSKKSKSGNALVHNTVEFSTSENLLNLSLPESDLLEDSDVIVNKSEINLLTETVVNLTSIIQSFVQSQVTSPSIIQNQQPPPTLTPQYFSPNLGESLLNIEPPSPSNQVQFSSGLPAGENLSDSLKTKIWNNQFVDFYDLLYPESEHNYSLSVNDAGASPTLSFVPRKKRTLTEREWCRAFDDYLATYTRTYPGCLLDLITYGKFVKDLMSRNQNWDFYDRSFRRDREHSLCKWTTIRIDLQIAASYNHDNSVESRYRGSASNAKNGDFDTIPFGYCFQFHKKGRHCTQRQCNWKHACPKCQARHPMYLCNDQRYSRQPRNSQFFEKNHSGHGSDRFPDNRGSGKFGHFHSRD